MFLRRDHLSWRRLAQGSPTLNTPWPRCRPSGASGVAAPGTQGLRPGLPSIAPAGAESGRGPLIGNDAGFLSRAQTSRTRIAITNRPYV